jgi:hypothetical protein|tara:strand:+ start:36 stop:2930 length:2895 start_codon:yes stop_codon:yes gene_type:complete
MASITQNIPTLNGGLSQQPDELKIPGQVSVAKNVIPDVTHGLIKRPGGKLIASLSDGTNNSNTNGRWFSYYRDEDEQYIGQISRAGDINVWRCSDGAEMVVNYDTATATALTNYLTHTDDEDLQTLTLNDYTFITNRTKTVSMSNTVEPVRPPEVFIDLKAISYARQYACNLYDNQTMTPVSTTTRISVELEKSSNNYCDTNGAMVARSSRPSQSTRCDDSAGDSRDAYAPNVGTRIFNVTDGDSLTDEGVSGSHTYTIDVKAANGTSVNRGAQLYFRIRTVGQSVPFTSGSGENQTTTYQARYTTTYDMLYGGTGWQQGDYFYVWMKDGYYKVTIEAISTTQVQANLGLIRPNPTPFDTETAITAESILGDIRKAIIDAGNFTSANIQQIGNGLYITRTSGAFNITAVAGDLLRVMSSEVKNVTDLPDQCKHGYVVKVANSEADEDDYYVKFYGNNDQDGDGVWEECNKPGRKIEFDKGTMPIQLVREANGQFKVSQVTWDNSPVGDPDITNPAPSFVGNTINKMVFYRNRMVMLSDENVIMSRPGDFFNFWSKTATTFTPTDVIDLSCSSNYPAIVYDGIQINTGLLLFTKNQQFMLTTDSDVLSPQTAKINAVSTYNFNNKTNPISLGTTVAFLDNANKYSRFFEMSNVLKQGEPDVVDQSKPISTLLPKDLSLISESRENSVVFFSQKNSSTLFGFRYFGTSEGRMLQAWFTWEVTGLIQYHCMMDDSIYLIVRNNNKDQMLKIALKLDDNGHFVTFNDDDYRVHVDHSTSSTGWTYNATTNKSTKAKPAGLESTAQLVAYDTDTGNNIGRYGKITINGSNMELDGDWSGETFIIGYLYEMDIQLPTIYTTQAQGNKTRADTKASLIIHRLKVNFGPVGVYETKLTRPGKPDYTDLKELAIASNVAANRVPVVDEVQQTIPCYERNTNLTINIKSSHPSPATIFSYAWEGDYSNRFYRRV